MIDDDGTIGYFRRVHLYGVEFRVHVRPGTGARPPLVLCNGIGANIEVLDPLVEALPKDLEIIRFDAPGTGSSSTPPYMYRFSGLAHTLGLLLTDLGYDRVDVLGFSWGGALAQQFAAQNPRRCRRLILAATGTGMISVPGRIGALSRMLTPRRYRDPAYAASIADRLYGGSLRGAPERAAEILGHDSHPGTSRGYLLQLLAGAGWTSVPWLPLIRQPSLLLFGDDDPIIPLANARILHTLLPHSTLHIFSGGHLDLLVKAPQLAPVIDRFLSHTEAPAPGSPSR